MGFQASRGNRVTLTSGLSGHPGQQCPSGLWHLPAPQPDRYPGCCPGHPPSSPSLPQRASKTPLGHLWDTSGKPRTLIDAAGSPAARHRLPATMPVSSCCSWVVYPGPDWCTLGYPGPDWCILGYPGPHYPARHQLLLPGLHYPARHHLLLLGPGYPAQSGQPWSRLPEEEVSRLPARCLEAPPR